MQEWLALWPLSRKQSIWVGHKVYEFDPDQLEEMDTIPVSRLPEPEPEDGLEPRSGILEPALKIFNAIKEAFRSSPKVVPPLPSLNPISQNVQPPPKPTPNRQTPVKESDNLASDRKVDYSKLRDLLKAKQWKETE